MKKLFVSLVALVMAAISYAQNTLVATLSHGDDITMYYGINALRDAHDVAQSGDIINLSGGAFHAVNITKAVTIRGAGVNDNYPTTISERFCINIPSSCKEKLNIEGCIIPFGFYTEGSLNNAVFLKDEIKWIALSDSVSSITFLNCKLHGMTVSGNSTAMIVNSYIRGFKNIDNSSAIFLNCVLVPQLGEIDSWPRTVTNSSLVNCIVDATSSNGNYSPSTSAINCVGCSNTKYNAFQNMVSCTNCSLDTWEIFDTSATTDWEIYILLDLNDEAKEKYLGTDGTQVGMYGGAFPYDMTPSYPKITKMNVANKTTADGKLSVEIEVNVAE